MFVSFKKISNVNAILVTDYPIGDDKIRHGANLIARKGWLLKTVNAMLVTNSDPRQQTTKLPTFLNYITQSTGEFWRLFFNFVFVDGLHSFAQYAKIINCILLIFFKRGFYFEDWDLLEDDNKKTTATLPVSNRAATFTRTSTWHPTSPHYLPPPQMKKINH